MEKNGKIVVFVSSHPKTHALLKAAMNKALETGLPWEAVYIETPEHYITDRESRERIIRFSALTEKMGGLFLQIPHRNALAGIKSYIKDASSTQHPVTYVIIGESDKEGFFAELKTSIAEKLVKRYQNKVPTIHKIHLSQRDYSTSWFDLLRLRDVRFIDIFYAFLAVAIAYASAEILRANLTSIEWKINNNNIVAFFLIGTVIVSLRCGLLPGLLSAILGFSTINYFYISPLHSFKIVHSAEGVGLTIFLVSSVLVSILGAYNQAIRNSIQQKEKRSQALYQIYRSASNATDTKAALEILHEDLTKFFEMQVAFFMPPAMNPDDIKLKYPQDISFSDNDLKSLELCWNEVRTTGLGALNHFESQWRFEPLTTVNSELGVLALKIPHDIRLDASFGRLVSALADQVSAILERIELTKMMGESQVREEREKLRAMLLSSVSHDLKTPLASIIGSLSIYKRMRKADRLQPETADELTDTALEEAQRLDSFISNILDMTRIESGDIEFSQEWIEASSVLDEMPKRLQQTLKKNKLNFNAPEKPFEVFLDKMMTEQVLQNLIDNAVKYSPKNTDVEITYGPTKQGFIYKVRDFGPGIPEDKFQSVFDKYERLKRSDSQVAGTGLGLAISKAVMLAQNGDIQVTNHPHGGAEFTIIFPQYKASENERSRLA